MGKLRDSADVVKLAKDLGLSITDPVEAILDHCRERISSWVTGFKGTLTLPRFHQLIDDRLSLHHVIIRSDHELDHLIAEQAGRGEVIFRTLKDEFAGGTEAITFKLRRVDVGMRRHLSVIDGRGTRTARVYFGKRHESSHLLCLSPRQLSFVFRRTHAIKNAAEEQLMDRIGGEVAFYPRLFTPGLARLQQQYGQPCFELVDDLRKEVCPEASWTATAIAVVEQNDLPAIFLSARYGSKIGDSGPGSASWALRVSARCNRAAKGAGLFIPWNYRVPPTSMIHRIFDAPFEIPEEHADERLGIWTASDGSHLPDLPIHVQARKHNGQINSIITLR